MNDFWNYSVSAEQRESIREQRKRIQSIKERENERKECVSKGTGKPVKDMEKQKEVCSISYEYRDVDNFWKVFPHNLFLVLRQLTEAETGIFTYMLEHMEFRGKKSTNLFYGSYTDLMKKTGYTRPTISSTMKKLQEINAAVMVKNGLWMVNPQIMARGKAAELYALQEDYNRIWLANHGGNTETDKEGQGHDTEG